MTCLEVKRLFQTGKKDVYKRQVYSQLSTIPEDGSHPVVEAYGLHIRVEKLEDQRVEWALVSKAEVKPAAEDSEKQ